MCNFVKFGSTLYLYWLELNLIFNSFNRKMSENFYKNFIPQNLENQSCLNDEPQGSYKKLESRDDASKYYSK